MLCIFKRSWLIVLLNHWIAKHKPMHRINNHPFWGSQSIDPISIFDLPVHANIVFICRHQASLGKSICRMSVLIQHHHVWTRTVSFKMIWSSQIPWEACTGHYQHVSTLHLELFTGGPLETCSKLQQSHCGTPLLMLLANVYGLPVPRKTLYNVTPIPAGLYPLRPMIS